MPIQRLALVPWLRVAVLVIVASGIALVGLSGFDRPIPAYQTGEFTDRSIRAPYEFQVVDEEATTRQREAAARRTPVVITVNQAVAGTLDATLARAVEPLAIARADVGPAPDPSASRTRRIAETRQRAWRAALDKAVATSVPELEAAVGPGASASLRAWIAQDDAPALLRAAITTIVTSAYQRPVVADVTALTPPETAAGESPWTDEVSLVSGGTERRGRVADAVRDVAAVRSVLVGGAPRTDLPPPIEAWLRRAVAARLAPNAIGNPRQTGDRRAAAADGVLPVSLSFRRNQLIIGEGQPVTRQALLALDSLRAQRQSRQGWSRVAGRAALLFVALALVFVTLDGRQLRFLDSDAMFLYGVTSISASVIALLAWDAIAERLLTDVWGTTALSAIIAFPSAAAAMYTRLVAPQATVARLLVAQAIVFGLLWQGDARLTFFVLASGWVGSHLVAECSRRHCVLKAGIVTGLVSAPIAAVLTALDSSAQTALAANALAGLASGLTSSLIVLALGPVYELVFGHVTRIRLVELVNYQHPLLRQLTEVTPGTFQHSIGVSILADAAARAVGGDALLVRVGALYHDVGKTTQPEMFIENQHGRNPHDQLQPLESARNIIEHVTEGVRLVREHRLGSRIEDFVREHHGTSPVHYFLDRARKSGEPFDPDDFAYPGPSPRSLETLILMLADQVEATARSMAGADAAAYEAMVDRTLDRAHADRQLADSPVTFHDLAAIREALLNTLLSMTHHRITYPGQPPGR